MSVYLDAAATTKPKQEVIEAMIPYLTEYWYNPSSLYGQSANVKDDVEKAKKVIANFIGAKSDEIYMTSGGCEGNSLAIQGFINNSYAKARNPVVITSMIEHKSIIECVESLLVNTDDLFYIPVNKEGFVDIECLEKILKYNKRSYLNDVLVSIQFANSEIGTIQYIKDIAEIVHKYDAVFHTDAVQAIPHISIDVNNLDVDMLTASGHKLGCPKGIGFLYKRNCVEIKPLIYGSQMGGLRGGTENVAGIIGLAKAIGLCDTSYKKNTELNNKRSYFVQQLIKEFGCDINGAAISRIPNNISATFSQNITGESLLYILDLSNIMISTGSACDSQSIEPSRVLKAIGLSDINAMKTVRFSLPDDITYGQIDYVIEEIKKSIKLIENN